MSTVDPEDRIRLVSNLCSLGNRPIIMTSLMRLLLIDHFCRDDDLENAEFHERLFRYGEETGILIEDATVWTPEKTQQRPAVIIKRNRWQCIKRGTLDSVKDVTAEGNTRHVKLWRGSHTLFCLAKEGAEAEILGDEVYRFFEHFGPVFRRYFGLLAFDLAYVDGPSEVEESSEHYAVPVTVGYGWDDTWLLYQRAPKIKKIKISEIYSPFLTQ